MKRLQYTIHQVELLAEIRTRTTHQMAQFTEVTTHTVEDAKKQLDVAGVESSGEVGRAVQGHYL